MSESLIFMMGDFAAELPCDRLYAKNHMWAMPLKGQLVRFGFSAYAVRLLQDIYFIEFQFEVMADLRNRQEFGNIESKKAESGLYAPMTGRLIRINESLLDDPSFINVDKYGEGWLIEMEGDSHEMLQPAQYVEHLELAWDVAQRTIKGQANTIETNDEE
jgi:glycine cleavage system H protein